MWSGGVSVETLHLVRVVMLKEEGEGIDEIPHFQKVSQQKTNKYHKIHLLWDIQTDVSF